jgi:hypothetical protein
MTSRAIIAVMNAILLRGARAGLTIVGAEMGGGVDMDIVLGSGVTPASEGYGWIVPRCARGEIES